MSSIFEAISGDRPAAAKMNLGLNISAEFPPLNTKHRIITINFKNRELCFKNASYKNHWINFSWKMQKGAKLFSGGHIMLAIKF